MADLLLGPHVLTPIRPGLPVMTLAPMAGVGHWVFRLCCARYGARVVGAEFVSSRTIDSPAAPVRRALDYADLPAYQQHGQTLLAPQIYGSDPALLAAAAQRVVALGATVVDLNFGCAVSRIVAAGAGGAFLRDLERLSEAVRRVVRAVDVPVTIKTRLGWDAASINVLEVVRRAEAAGARAVAIHARTVRQRFGGTADWSWIARARAVAQVPIIGNGDVRTPDEAARRQRETGCDAVMIGRAAMACPWIFAGRDSASRRERIELILQRLADMVRFKGERTGVLETRRYLALYFADLPRHGPFMQRLLTTTSHRELDDLLQAWHACPDTAGPEHTGSEALVGTRPAP